MAELATEPDGIGSGLFYDRRVSLQSGLSRRSEDPTDLGPRDADRTCHRDRVDHFTFTTGPRQGSTSQQM
jgi:hypothetical protein